MLAVRKLSEMATRADCGQRHSSLVIAHSSLLIYSAAAIRSCTISLMISAGVLCVSIALIIK